jgi:CHAT domain-containing protein
VARQLHASALFGKQVTREAMIEALMSADILHFAGHGFLDLADPLRSGLVLADGVLTARDLRGLPVHARLVVLNACESGVHAVGLGAELQGFVRALLLAGADLVLCTQLAIDDDVARDFAEHYYGELSSRGSDPMTAAWNAQNALLRRHGANPELWSPFIVVG